MAGLTVLCGGGGVGKTTTAAALGVALARAGRRTLVVTVDPARRLADAMGVAVGARAQEVPTDFDPVRPIPAGVLHARMPEVRTLADDFVAWLIEDEAARARVHANAAYRELADAIVGTHELLALTLVEIDLQSGRYDHVVLDTAPSRHAIDFLTAPRRLLDLLEMRALRWVADLARPKRRGGDGGAGEGRGPGRVARWSRGRVEALLGRVVGLEAVASLGELLGEVVHVRRRWADVIRAAYRRLLGGGARFLVVGAPSGAAVDDVGFLVARLGELGVRETAIVLNRADVGPPHAIDALLRGLERAPDSEALRGALAGLRREYEERAMMADRALASLGTRGRTSPVVRLPLVAAREPADVVRALAVPLERIVPLVAPDGAPSRGTGAAK